MSESVAKSHDGDYQDGPGHVVPLPVLFGVLVSLLVLTGVNLAIARIDLGALNLAVVLTVAVVKASLVALYFMHLRWDRPFNGLILIFSLALVALFIGLSLLDSIAYQPDVIPGYAPEINR